MNKDVIKGQWKQLKGQIKQKWAKLTDNDMQRIEGNADEAVGVLQERYGRTKDEAQREWNEFCESCTTGRSATNPDD